MSPDRAAPAEHASSACGRRTSLRPEILLGPPDVGRSDADSHGQTPDGPPAPPSEHVHGVTTYSVEPASAPDGPPRPSAGPAPVAACARPPRPSPTPCAGVPSARRPPPPAPAPRSDPTPSRCVLVAVPPDHVDFLGANAQRGRGRHGGIFSQHLTRSQAKGLLTRIVCRLRPGLKRRTAPCPPAHDLSGLPARAPQRQAYLVRGSPCRLHESLPRGRSRPFQGTSWWGGAVTSPHRGSQLVAVLRDTPASSHTEVIGRAPRVRSGGTRASLHSYEYF